MRKTPGFSLIELVISVALASLVLVAVASLSGNIVRRQVEGIRSGTETGWSIVSYMRMAKEIEDANVLAYPITDNTAQDSILICKNWSRGAGAGSPGARLNTDGVTGIVSVIQYCVDSTDPANLVMRRYANVGLAVTCPCTGVACATTAPVACDAAGPGWTENGVVGIRLEKLAAQNVFLRTNSMGGVKVRYVIGTQTATANVPIPKFTVFDFGIAMQKQYNSAVD